MEPRTIQYIAESCGGSVIDLDPKTLVKRICTDSRTIEPGDLFVAVRGDTFDGHDFVADVIARGAVGAVVRADWAGAFPGIVVPDTRAALCRIGGRYRSEFDFHAVAVAGSNGKTTTKELIASVLRQAFPTVASAGSFNNDIGVPLTLLRLEAQHQAGVFEAGTNHPGELGPLLKLIGPSIGVLTNIGREHLEFFGNLEGVLREEGTLAEVLPSGGLLVIHGDGFGAEELRRRSHARVARVGSGLENEWRIVSAHFDPEGTHFVIETAQAEYSGNYTTRLLGTHQAINATFAIVAGAELGLTREQIQKGLSECAGAKMRLQLKHIDDFLVIDDAYNANADSMQVALDTLGVFPCRGRRIAVLGDMAELGAESVPAHEEVGRRAAERRIDCLVTVGQQASLIARAARAAGLREVLVSEGVEQAGPAVQEIVRSGDVVLVKASRSARLERVVDYLTEKFGAK